MKPRPAGLLQAGMVETTYVTLDSSFTYHLSIIEAYLMKRAGFTVRLAGVANLTPQANQVHMGVQIRLRR
jgi:hypothetical protein